MRRTSFLVALLVLCSAPAPARAWNPLKAAAAKLRSIGHGIGGVLGAPAGGFIEAATTPTIHNVEDAGHRLIGDLDFALSSNIDHAHAVVGAVLDQASTVEDKVNGDLQARILQIQTGLDKTVDHGFDRLDLALGRLDRDANRLVDRAEKLFQQLDAKVADHIAAIDKVLATRISDLRALVTSSVKQADDAAKARIAQLDELAGKRLGNLDVIATKQSLSLEGMLVRIAALIGLVGLIAFVAWRLFREGADALSYATAEKVSRLKALGTKGALRIVPQLALAAGGALLLLYLSKRLPRDSAERAQQQLAQQTHAFGDAVKALDVVAARYHQSQLEVLAAPADNERYRTELQRLELLHGVFTRPGQLSSPEGLASLVAEVTRVDDALHNSDPEIQIAKAYILWQVGGSRDDEYEAATLCAGALARAPDSFLAPLARNYITAFLHDPYAPPPDGMTIEQLRRAADQPASTDTRFVHVIQLDKLIAELDRGSTDAYLDMLSAQADLEVALAKAKGKPDAAGVTAARDARNAAAAKVVDAWAAFDRVLDESPAFANDAVVLTAFTLDDSVLTHARFYVAAATSNERPPMLTASAPAKALTPVVRAKIAPLRVAWEQRYAPLLGAREREIVSYEEAVRFKTLEQRSSEFETHYLDYLVAVRANAAPARLRETGIAAAMHAAGMGLYRDLPGGRVAEASRLIDELNARGQEPPAEVLADVATAYRMRRLRFL